MKLSTGTEFYLPVTPMDFMAVPSGTYRERSTGELITNPDFLTVWSAQPEAHGDSSTLDWSRGMSWERPIHIEFPGDHWSEERAF